MSTGYVFADTTTDGNGDADVQRSVMMHALAQVYDPFSTDLLDRAEIPLDARCLVVAVGASKVAARLADLAPQGEVIATDLDHTHTVHDDRVQLLTHNVVTDPLPPGGFDVIHVRLLLAHLPERLDVLAKLAAALNPAGLLVVEEFEGTWDTSVLAAPSIDEADRLFRAYHTAFQSVLAASGVDLAWGRRVHTQMLALGLDADTEGHTRTWRGDSAGTRLPSASARLLRDRLIAHGMPAGDIDAFRALLRHPQLRVKSNLALSTHGRRPA
jgi:SAM-dependent methyltransferase